MQSPGAALHFYPQRSPSRRYASVAFVAAIHAALIYALLTGLRPAIVKVVDRAMDTHVIEADVVKPVDTPKPVQPTLEKPVIHNTAVEPQIRIDNSAAPPITTAPAQPPVSDSAASSVSGTHSTPPYPPDARRLNQEGTVVLQLTIGVDGRVVTADVVRSSGVPELDQTASAWVLAHWRYKPAMQGGVAVMSSAQAAVKFDLRSAR